MILPALASLAQKKGPSHSYLSHYYLCSFLLLLERIYCKIWASETYNKQSRNLSFLIKGHFLTFRGLTSNMKLYFCIPHDPVYQLYKYQLEMNDLPVREKCVWIIRQYILMVITTAQWGKKTANLTHPWKWEIYWQKERALPQRCTQLLAHSFFLLFSF